jgi:molecular chaperone GrpE
MPRSSMTSARKPAGAPDGWDRKPPAGTPEDREAAAAPEEDREAGPAGDRVAPGVGDEEAARVDSDFDALLADVTRERDEYLELAQRARADFENYRKRAARDAEDAERRGKTGLARELLPALDNLERALDTAADGDAGGGALAEGVTLVARELREALARVGVESYDPTGERFDPSWHEALSTRAAEGMENGVVLETVQKGYRLDGQVLRPARVVVSG